MTGPPPIPSLYCMASPTHIGGPQKPLIHNAGKLVAMAASTAMIALGLLLLRLRASGRTLRAMSLLIHVACDLWTGVVSLISSAELWRPSFELPKDQWQWPAFGF